MRMFLFMTHAEETLILIERAGRESIGHFNGIWEIAKIQTELL